MLAFIQRNLVLTYCHPSLMKKTTYYKSGKICPHNPLIFVLFELPVYRESGCQQQNSVIVCMFTQDYAFSNWSQSYPPPLSNTPALFNHKHTKYFSNSPEFKLISVNKVPMRKICWRESDTRFSASSFSSWISGLRALEYPNRTVSIFFENLRKYSRMNVYQRCQRRRR